MYKRLQNFGTCKMSRCMTSGPRCTFGYCVTDCHTQHEYWAGHAMADGGQSPATKKMADIQHTAVSEIPEPDRVPEPGDSEELLDVENAVSPVFVPVEDTSRLLCGKSGFPLKYVQ